ncbi:hypothetical protein FDH96_gp138 [Mycobacterium phage Rey]|uniref:DNA-binding phage zinc finger domain-containing protein n=1 Tax=Mycobacterium phage Rey TaxID=1034115 RepID=G1D5I1_9CAUD|nr:hypothetical protein FDH96_gp138 [Mycobacterium phage Rey]AEK10029.1 hypothetical protein PBI_REY_141 [Mycobacterium phage Rey]
MSADTLTITYKLPRQMSANDWLFSCLREGDHNGVLEWVMNHNLSIETVKLGYADKALNHMCPTCEADPGEPCWFRPGSGIENGKGYKHMTRGAMR